MPRKDYSELDRIEREREARKEARIERHEEASTLFAAAPDLLAAAIWARDVFEMIRDNFPDELRCGHASAWVKLDAAITKATILPEPPYDREVDGDYTSFLVRHNCD